MKLPDRLSALTARVEAVTLVVLAVVALALLAFGRIASEMTEGDLDAFDRAVLLAFRNPADPSDPIGPGAVEVAMRDLTALGGITVLGLVTLLGIVLLVLKRRYGTALVMAVALLGGQGLSTLAKLVFDRPRPDLVPHGVDVVSASFPSGHSMMAAVTWLTLAVLLARIEPSRVLKGFYIAVAVLLTVLVGISRVYLGVHWPSDVLAGWAAGAAWALAWDLAARRLARRGRTAP